ncbi:BLUF domain-containing protein [Methylobacterium gregans]|uniref:BLUF domain-containing protein n=1 Tax=Methylobacterium gregans TaxID=374424 RepID=UPI003610A953
MSDLYRLVYASKNLLQGSEAEIAEAVSQILAASQRNNAAVGVTGALMFNAGAFAQVLEGPQDGVEATFERIQCDPRHGDVTVLQCGVVESRTFANWSMAFVGQSRAGRARWEGIAAASGFDLTRLDGDAVFAMLHGLVLEEEGLAPPPPPRPSRRVHPTGHPRSWTWSGSAQSCRSSAGHRRLGTKPVAIRSAAKLWAIGRRRTRSSMPPSPTRP